MESESEYVLRLLDVMVTAMEEGFSYDGIVSPPGAGLEDARRQSSWTDWVKTHVTSHRRGTRASPSASSTLRQDHRLATPSVDPPHSDHALLLLDDMITAVEEGFSYDGIVSLPEAGLEDARQQSGLAGWVETHMKSRRRGTRFAPNLDSRVGNSPGGPEKKGKGALDDAVHRKVQTSLGVQGKLPGGRVSPSPSDDPKLQGKKPEKVLEDDTQEGDEKRLVQLDSFLGSSPPEALVTLVAGMSELPSYRCPTCKSASENPRNLVVFIDGTSTPGDKNTNVVKLLKVIDESPKRSGLEQHTYYLKGIGAYELDQLGWMGRMRKAVHSGLEQAFARSADKNIKDAYHWLTEHYREGDQIYLFGFSGGGFQVRALASMIHEVGLVREKEETESAYDHYKSIDLCKPETRRQATQFKQMYCWQGVRIHFMGVWDTVSSLGFMKKDVHVTPSSSVTNACHLRHALALDESRVKFMPEYFLEMNAHHSGIKSPRLPIGDIKEVWFPGSHADVGGTERRLNALEDEDSESYLVHAGNVPLLWMRREAADKGLVFKQTELSWDPEDVDFGTKDSMPPGNIRRVFEYLPTPHQISFSGTGEQGSRLHRSHPRSVIPGQKIHNSTLSGYMYTPRATLRNSVCIPTVNQNPPEGLWTAGPADEKATTRLLSSLLSDRSKTLECLGKVLLLLDSELGSGQIESVPRLRWPEEDIQVLGESDFAKFALTVIYDATSGFTASEGLVTNAKASLNASLNTGWLNPDPDHLGFHETVKALQFLTKHQMFRQRFCDNGVTRALVLALGWSGAGHTKHSFPLITESLCNLIRDDDLRHDITKQLIAEKDTLLAALETRSPNQLVALLKMIATASLFESDRRGGLQRKITWLAKRGESPVGPAAVEALVALKAPLTRDVHIFSILGYLCNTLPQLDADGGDMTSIKHIDLPPVLCLDGLGQLDEEVVGKLVSTIKLRDPRKRTAATLTIVKLCGNATVRNACKRNKVLDICMLQLAKKRTSLLAAYALNVFLKYEDMWAPGDYARAAQLIVAMLFKGWFDDAVGQVEGCEILRGLMASGDLRQHIDVSSVCTTLVRKLEVGRYHEVRMNLSYFDILGKEERLEFTQIVANNVDRLRERDRKVQTKGVRVLAHLAQTMAGEQAIKPHLIEIVKMVLPSPDYPFLPHDQLFGPAAALYGLSKNETLREEIRRSPAFSHLKNQLQRRAALHHEAA